MHLVFVHGAWHGAWCWQRTFIPYFEAAGYTCHAFDLPYHGARLSEGSHLQLTFASSHTYLHDLHTQLEAIPAPYTLIGHSMGGYLVQKLLETHQPAAAVLLTSIPVSGTWAMMRHLMRHYTLDMLRTGLLLDNGQLVRRRQAVREHFFSADVPDEVLDWVCARLQSESIRVLLDTDWFNPPRPEDVHRMPMLVVAAENDTLFSVAEERATAAAYDADFQILPDTAHDAMLDTRWHAAADVIAAWLANV